MERLQPPPVRRNGSESADTSTHAINQWRQANNSLTARVSAVRGLDEDQVEASYGTPTINSAAGWGFNAIGVDSTSAFSGRAGYSSAVSGTGWNQGSFVGHVGIGFRFVQAIEIVTSGAGTITFTGRRRPSSIQSGLFATVHA